MAEPRGHATYYQYDLLSQLTSMTDPLVQADELRRVCVFRSGHAVPKAEGLASLIVTVSAYQKAVSACTCLLS